MHVPYMISISIDRYSKIELAESRECYVYISVFRADHVVRDNQLVHSSPGLKTMLSTS